MKKLFAIICILALLLCGCGKNEPAMEAPTEPQQQETTPPTEATEPPTEPVVEEPTEPTVESFLHSGIREDGSFDEGTLFIGDSLTNGLLAQYVRPNGFLGDARYMAIPGASPLAFFDGPALGANTVLVSFNSWEFRDMIMSEAVASAGESVTAVYFMMGTNHQDSVTEQYYADIISYILEKCPNATIYMQQVPYSLSSLVDQETINWRIWGAYNRFVESGETRVRLIPTQEAIELNVQEDEVHLTEEGYRLWYEALVAYAQENGIPQ